MDNKNENKKSKLVFNPKITRKLLKMNGEIRFCPFCGKPIEEDCECHKNIIIDSKPLRGSDNDASVPVFHNNKKFQADFAQLIEEEKAKKEATREKEFEQITMDLG